MGIARDLCVLLVVLRAISLQLCSRTSRKLRQPNAETPQILNPQPVSEALS